MSVVDNGELSLASPERARSLLTVRAAISSASSLPRPRSNSSFLMCSYCRSRSSDQAVWGIDLSFRPSIHAFPGRGVGKPTPPDLEFLCRATDRPARHGVRPYDRSHLTRPHFSMVRAAQVV